VPDKGRDQGVFLQPPDAVWYDRHQVAFATTLAILLIAGPAVVSVAILAAGEPERLLGTLPFALVGVAGLILLRRDAVRLAFQVLAYGIWACAVNALFWTQGLTGTTFGALVIVLAFAGWLAGATAAFVLTAATPPVLFLFAYLEASGWPVSIGASVTAYQRALIYSLTALGSGILGYFGAASMRERVGRLLDSQHELSAKLAELGVRDEALRRFRIAMDATADAIYLVDRASLNFIDVNEGACRMQERTRQELFALGPEGVFAASRGELERIYDAVIASDARTEPVQERRLRKDGSPIWLELHYSAQHSDNAWMIVIVVHDITERKQAEATRASLEAQLRESQKMEALGTLAGGVAHDFNNVLAAITGNVELARQDVGQGHAALVSLEEIGKASRRAKDLVQQILHFGRRQTLALKATSLSLVTLESARLIRATLPADVSLNVECKANTPAVLADAAQVKQILLNLCQNALHAVQGQARPGVIGICLVAVTQIEPRSDLAPGRYACLSVRDNGSGMDAATRSRMFEPFFTTKPKGKGTGLGLSVVHGIAQGHGASIEIDSVLGKGSEFRIYFPATEVPVVDDATSAPVLAPTGGRRKHILYVDDEEAIIFLMTRLLERRGYRVSGFTNPREALAAARADPYQFDLAVTDYNMPGMTGLELAAALSEIRADLPMVLASGYITEELRQKAPAAGVRELIYKPDTVEELCEAVARCASAQTGQERAT